MDMNPVTHTHAVVPVGVTVQITNSTINVFSAQVRKAGVRLFSSPFFLPTMSCPPHAKFVNTNILRDLSLIQCHTFQEKNIFTFSSARHLCYKLPILVTEVAIIIIKQLVSRKYV